MNTEHGMMKVRILHHSVFDIPYFYPMAKYTMEKVAGMYYLQEVKETASGFKLEKDGTFKFFFSYGALDRYGSGNWTMQDDQVVLQSRI